MLAACGAGGRSQPASALVQETLRSSATAASGRLAMVLRLAPSGPPKGVSTITLDLTGAFQSRGDGRLPAWEMSFHARAGQRSLQLGVVCTGRAAYLLLPGGTYRLPSGAFARLATDFDRVAARRGGIAGRLGLSASGWIVRPRVVGLARASGHARGRVLEIRAGLRTGALLRWLRGLLARAHAAGAGAPGWESAISPASGRSIPVGVREGSVALWTSTPGHLLHGLQLELTLPVGGELSRLLGGAHLARAALSLRYAQLDRPQRISVPADLRPAAQLATRLALALSPAPGGGAR
jgi:hypothetical protein